MRVSPTNAEFHWVREHMNMPSQPQQTGVCPALLLGWTPPGCSCQSCSVSAHRAVSAVTSAERWREFCEQGSLMQWSGSWIVPIKLMTVCLGRITVSILWFIYCVLHLTAFRSLGQIQKVEWHLLQLYICILKWYVQISAAPWKKRFSSLIYSVTE